MHAASEGFGAERGDIPNGLVLDVRRAGVFEVATTQLPGAAWRDPADVAQWATDLPHDRPVTVYCVYGHEVGRATALRLRASGVGMIYVSHRLDEVLRICDRVLVPARRRVQIHWGQIDRHIPNRWG